MSQRTLLIAALALMAGGLLLGIVGTVFSDTGRGVQSEQGFGPGPQQRQGPEGQFPPGFGPRVRRGNAPMPNTPAPTASPSTIPNTSASP